MEKELKEFKERIENFDNETFLGHYSTLINVAIDAGKSEEIMLTLDFLTSLKHLLDNIKEEIENNEKEI